MTADAPRHGSMARHQSQPDALVAYMLPTAHRSAAALRTVRDLAEQYGWSVAWHAAVEAVYCRTDPEFVLPTFQGWCQRIAERQAR